MIETRNVCRCPVCGSTRARFEPERSRDDRTFMTCPECGHGSLCERWEVVRDWFVRLELAAGAAPPPRLPPQTDQERAEREPRARWVVMAHDPYAREDRVVASFESELAAQRRLRELQAAEPAPGSVWIVRSEP